jgi:hypothetical protein
MTAFILSSAIAFALYQLLAFTEWPAGRRNFVFYRVTLRLSEAAARFLRRFVRLVIVVAILLSVLTIHNLAAPIDTLARHEVNIIFGFVFGPLFAIWVNSVIVHSTGEDLTRGQIVAVIGLVLLFLLGAVGSETSGLIRQYARNLSSLKLGVAELSFTAKEPSNRDRLASTPISGTNGAYVTGGSQGLQNLASLDVIIDRDHEYLKKVLGPKDKVIPVQDLDHAKEFAQSSVAPPLRCLFAWFQQTGDSSPVEKYLARYADIFQQLEALNARVGMSTDAPPGVDERKTRLEEISSDLVRNGLTMALDIALSATSSDVLNTCKPWFDLYCGVNDQPASGDKPGGSFPLPQCLRDRLKQFDQPPGTPRVGEVGQRISSLAGGLDQFVAPQPPPADRRGLEALPYFAIGRASLMSQLGQHEAAAAILDDWLHMRRGENAQDKRQEELQANPLLQIKDDWFALRVRSMLVAYVEERLEDVKARTATVVLTEHLDNLQATRDGFKSRLRKADFFQKLDDSCRAKCEPVFKRPTECDSDEQSERLQLWRRLYTSYITMEYTFIHRALEHPNYGARFAETVNDEAQRLVNFDLSCGTDHPEPEVVYGQSLLAFAENAVSYSRLRARLDDEATQNKRLDAADRAAKFGLEIVNKLAADDQERANKRYLDRISPSFAVQVQEQLRIQLKRIDQVRKDLTE